MRSLVFFLVLVPLCVSAFRLASRVSMPVCASDSFHLKLGTYSRQKLFHNVHPHGLFCFRPLYVRFSVQFSGLPVRWWCPADAGCPPGDLPVGIEESLWFWTSAVSRTAPFCLTCTRLSSLASGCRSLCVFLVVSPLVSRCPRVSTCSGKIKPFLSLMQSACLLQDAFFDLCNINGLSLHSGMVAV